MTLLAGAFGRRADVVLDERLSDQLQSLLSRHRVDSVTIHGDARCILAKLDLGIYGSSGLREDADGSVSLLAGDPLLASGESAVDGSRSRALDVLHAAASRRCWNDLLGARGVFCSAHYRPAEGQLTLVADKLGIRPIYYWIGPDVVVFASALRVLEGLSLVPKEMDLCGIVETKAIGVPTGERTVYTGISLMRAGEVLQVCSGGVSRSRYWRWDEVPGIAGSEDALLDEAYDRFCSAIDLRLRGQERVAGFLSGGLDSRCIVALLRERRTTVHTFNFARPGTQDQLFGKEFARLVATDHHELPIVEKGGNAKYAHTLAAALDGSPPAHADFPLLSRLVWSGDGGSIGLGHVRVHPAVVSLLRGGQQTRAVDLFLERQRARLPMRLFRTPVAERLGTAIPDGIHEELADIRSPDPGRALHLFLMLNDQRRHLADHFEHIDLHRVEYQLPFFDSRFLELIVALPLDACLGHRFYTKWLSRFPAVVTSVPWQTYPGHQPCPLPIPQDLGYQWDRDVSTLTSRQARKGTRLREARDVLRAPDFPYPLLRKSRAALMFWAYRFGLRDYGYAMDYLKQLHCQWRLANGKYALPPSLQTDEKRGTTVAARPE